MPPRMPSGAISKSRLRADWICVAVAAGAAVVTFYDFFAAREPPGQRILYAAVWLGTLGAALLTLPRGRFIPSAAMSATAYLVLMAAFLLAVPFQPVIYLGYVAGDLASLTYPVLLLCVASGRAGLFRDERLARGVFYLLLLGSLLSPFMPDESGRFEPPHIFAISYVIALMFGHPRGRVRAGAWILAGLTLLLAFTSTVRTNLLLLLIGFAVGAMCFTRFHSRRRLLSGILLFAGLLMLVQPIRVLVSDRIAESRFKTFTSGRQDESLLERGLELLDVVRTIDDEWGPLQYVIGYGHGATYRPFASFIAPNVTPELRVHSIHIGPAMVFFRYGAVGLALVLLLAAYIIRALIQTARDREAHHTQIAFVLAMVLFSLDFLLRNVFVDPLFPYVSAGFLVIMHSAGQTRYNGPLTNSRSLNDDAEHAVT